MKCPGKSCAWRLQISFLQLKNSLIWRFLLCLCRIDGRKIFQDFLRCEYSEENILFWVACEELKSEKDAKNIAIKARDIYEDYISILSAKEVSTSHLAICLWATYWTAPLTPVFSLYLKVSLDSRVRDIINNNIKKPTSNIFDEAQLQIYTLMHRDSYPRFINSAMYKKLAQVQSSSRKGSN